MHACLTLSEMRKPSCVVLILAASLQALQPCRVSAEAVPNEKPKLVLFRSASIPDCIEDFSAGLSFEAAQGVATNNFGNMVWKHAAPRLFDLNRSDLQCVMYSDANDAKQVSAVLYPTANWVFNESDADTPWNVQQKKGANYLNGLFGSMKTSILFVGVGCQAEFDTGGPENFVMDRAQVAVFETIMQQTPIIAVRGAYTSAVFRNHGIAGAVAVGCPSLFWNHNPQLGQVVEQKLRTLEKIPPSELRVGITLFLRRVGSNIEVLLAMLEKFPKAKVILQANGDTNIMYELQKANGGTPVPKDRTVFFYNPYTWQKELQQDYDVIVGHRIHGSMMALAAEVPMIVFPGDHRINELARTMMLPVMNQEAFGEPTFDIYEAARTVDFDGAAFDCNRRSVARIYNDWFATAGMAAHPGMRSLFEEDSELQYSISESGTVVTERCSLQPETLAVEKGNAAESLAQLLGQRTGEEEIADDGGEGDSVAEQSAVGDGKHEGGGLEEEDWSTEDEDEYI